MIIDTIDKLSDYVELNPLFADVVAFLKANDLQTLEPGKTHIKMIDIQIPISCAETFGYTPLSDLPPFEYNEEKDITKYGDTKAQDYVTLDPGLMAIFFPEDGHAPCIIDEPEIKKAIFKVKVQ